MQMRIVVMMRMRIVMKSRAISMSAEAFCLMSTMVAGYQVEPPFKCLHTWPEIDGRLTIASLTWPNGSYLSRRCYKLFNRRQKAVEMRMIGHSVHLLDSLP